MEFWGSDHEHSLFESFQNVLDVPSGHLTSFKPVVGKLYQTNS